MHDKHVFHVPGLSVARFPTLLQMSSGAASQPPAAEHEEAAELLPSTECEYDPHSDICCDGDLIREAEASCDDTFEIPRFSIPKEEEPHFVKIIELVTGYGFSGVTQSLLDETARVLNRCDATLDMKNVEHALVPAGCAFDAPNPKDLQARALAIMSASTNFSHSTFVCGKLMPHEVALVAMMGHTPIDRTAFHSPKAYDTKKIVKFGRAGRVPDTWENTVCDVAHFAGRRNKKVVQEAPILCIGDDDSPVVQRLVDFGKTCPITSVKFTSTQVSPEDLCYAIWETLSVFFKKLASSKSVFFEVVFHGSLALAARAARVISKFAKVYCSLLDRPISTCFLAVVKNFKWDEVTEKKEYLVWQIATIVFSQRGLNIEGKYRGGVLVAPTIHTKRPARVEKVKASQERKYDFEAEKDRESDSWIAEKEFRTFFRADADAVLSSMFVLV